MAGRRGSPRLVAARVSTPGWTPDVWAGGGVTGVGGNTGTGQLSQEQEL